ncbi:insulinase family protein [Dasania marina]|uniref:insulinase family protein n=1 Tax=Dasania marina TaxID=471499 RepID=UPI000363A538|nr:insulinase family protein [Dasania marina]
MLTKPQQHPAFELIRSQAIGSLNVTVEEYHHKKTGAVHYHMAADNDENVFLVALRTVPHDSTGVAHILEHTALCGSEKFPVRDPFFMMIRRSLNTFMNAFTSSDWTAYPFASQNRKDFNNLLEVYLDAVFFSRLDELDFAQEGHRIEFAEADNSDSDLVYKGVVFNEMKGAMSSVPSTLWQTLCKYLYPTNTYHYNSGGEPADIPDLSYQELKDFYRSHYHPSNAIFMTFGDIPAAEHHARFEEQALKRFEALDIHIHVPPEKRYLAPLRVQESYAFNEEGSSDNKTHVVMGWLFGESSDLQAMLRAQLLTSVLLDNSASPLQQALETTDLGSAPSPLCGLEDSMRELTFVCGLEGTEARHAEAVEQLILATLQEVADNGVPQEQVEAVLHQLELHQREVGGDSYPFGLQLILTAMGSATHRGDPIALLNLDPVLEQLHEDIKDPNFIKQLAQDLLLNNPHRVTLVMTPDQDLAQRRDVAEATRLAAIKAQLQEQDTQKIIAQAKTLADRQQQKDDESILPKVGLDDVPEDIHIVDGVESLIGELPLMSYAQGTNGLVYQQIIIELPPLSDELLAIMPYYTSNLTELGIGEQDYLSTQSHQATVCGSINAYSTLRGSPDDEQAIKSYFVLSSKALVRNQLAQAQLMQDTLLDVRFDELPRLRELMSQQRARRDQSVSNNGHSLAMTAASSGMSPQAALSHKLSGLQGIQTLKGLDQANQDEATLAAYAQQLQSLHQHILAGKKQLLLIAEADKLAECQQTLAQLWGQHANPGLAALQLPAIREQRKQIWVANTQVNFCAKAYPTVTSNHPDGAALTVLGGFLRNGYLHRVIREQGGAYGGGASQDNNIAAFKFYSYRDPRIVETLNDFDAAIDWLLSSEHDEEHLEQAILGVISSLDKPSSPAGEAKTAFHNTLFDRTPAQRRAFRARVLKVTLDDLKRVTANYLKPELASLAIVTHQGTSDQLKDFAQQQQVEIITL